MFAWKDQKMILTESEARTKLCCGPENCGAVERTHVSSESTSYFASKRYCCASDCMSWRWVPIDILSLKPIPTNDEFYGTCGLAS